MKPVAGRHPKLTRRTTLTLPADSLLQAEKLARARHLNLSAVVAEALAEGLRITGAAARGAAVLKNYERAFAGFSESELMLLDGIVMEPKKARSKRKR